jgi:hypothetical protein
MKRTVTIRIDWPLVHSLGEGVIDCKGFPGRRLQEKIREKRRDYLSAGETVWTLSTEKDRSGAGV